jgi:pilus assembly protein Flp/PilA
MFDLKAFARDDAGATAVEYALMIVLIAAVIVGSVSLIGPKLNAILVSASNGLTPS